MVMSRRVTAATLECATISQTTFKWFSRKSLSTIEISIETVILSKAPKEWKDRKLPR